VNLSMISFLFSGHVSGPESFRAPTCNSVHNQSERDLPPDQLKALYEVLPSYLILILMQYFFFVDLCFM
jgi:hypothetical protein